MASKKHLFMVTFFVTAMIFIIGILLGMKFDDMRADNGNELLVQASLDAESYVVQSDFLNAFGSKSCSVMEPRFDALQFELANLGEKLTDYDSKKMAETQTFYNLKKKYFIQEASALVLTKKLVDECSPSSMNIIYFYKIDDPESLKQGYALDKLFELKNNTHIFSFDVDFDEPTLNMLKEFYNVTEAPTIVINFEEVHKGFISYGELVHYKK